MREMRRFLPTPRSKKWWIEFQDHTGRLRRVPGDRDRKTTDAIGRRVKALVACRAGGERPDPELNKWVERLPASLRDKLAAFDLLDKGRIAAMRPLLEHLDGAADAPGLRQYLAAKGNTAGHVELVCARVRRMIDGCGFVYWSDITPTRVMAFLGDMRADKRDAKGKVVKRGASIQTSNFYLAALKQFGRWMVREGRAGESPVAYLGGLNVRTDRRHERRALSVDDLIRLVIVTHGQPNRFGMTGPERALLYRLATETGLRANELRTLTRAGFNLDGTQPTVTVQAGYSKHRRRDTLPLRPDTAGLLREYLADMLPGAPVFTVPEKTAKMLRADLDAASIDYRDDAGRVFDFHALRGETATLLAAAQVYPKVVQSIMRHSTIGLTMNYYTHTLHGQEADAVAALPDLGQRKIVTATGTDGGA